MAAVKVLLVEDNERLGELHRDFLDAQSFDLLWLKRGDEVGPSLAHFSADIILLDLMLPGKTGIDVCREIRTSYNGKILILTSSEDDFDHVICLELGADDFVTKPINPRVLLARMRMLLRNRDTEPEPKTDADCIRIGNLKLKRLSRETCVGDKNVRLTDAEFKLLWKLASAADQAVERAELFKIIRGIEFDGLDRSVDTKIVALRKKLDDNGDIPKRIITVRNQGYLLASDGWLSA